MSPIGIRSAGRGGVVVEVCIGVSATDRTSSTANVVSRAIEAGISGAISSIAKKIAMIMTLCIREQ